MTDQELEEIASSIASIRKAVRTNNPLLRRVAASRVYAALGFPFGIIIIVLCMIASDATTRYGCIFQAPAGIRILSWTLLGTVLAAGGWVKIIFTTRVAKDYDKNTGFWSVVKALYGGKVSGLILASFIAIASGVAFTIWKGSPWYIVPATSILVSFAAFGLDFLVDLIEYRVMGWYALLSGCAALVSIEKDPFLTTAWVYGGLFLAFGVAGLLRKDRTGNRTE